LPEFDFQRNSRVNSDSAGSASQPALQPDVETRTRVMPVGQQPQSYSQPAQPMLPSFTPAATASARYADDGYADTPIYPMSPVRQSNGYGSTGRANASMPVAAAPRQRSAQYAGQPNDSTHQPRKGNIITDWFTKPGKHGFLSSFLWLATFVCLGIMGLRVAPNVDQDGRALPEIIAFVPVAGLVSVVVLIFALLWRRRLLTVVSIVCVAVQVAWHIGFFVLTAKISDEAKQTVAAAASTDDNVARIMTLNTKEGNASATDIVRIVREEHVEVLALQEVSQDLLNNLQAAGLYDILPYNIMSAASAQDNGGLNGVWTMAPMSNPSQSLLPIETSQMPAGTIQIGDKQVRFVSAHPNSPTRGKQSLWSEGLGTIGDLKNYDWTYVVMGDFNSTWDHPRFRALLGDRFVDAGEQAGEGYHFTYPGNSKIPPVIEIDHIIHDKGVTVADLETVTVPGSDHRALLATLES